VVLSPAREAETTSEGGG